MQIVNGPDEGGWTRNEPIPLSLKRQLPMANLRKILAIKNFRISHQIHKGYASIFVKPFSSRFLPIFTMFNCRFNGLRFRRATWKDFIAETLQRFALGNSISRIKD